MNITYLFTCPMDKSTINKIEMINEIDGKDARSKAEKHFNCKECKSFNTCPGPNTNNMTYKEQDNRKAILVCKAESIDRMKKCVYYQEDKYKACGTCVFFKMENRIRTCVGYCAPPSFREKLFKCTSSTNKNDKKYEQHCTHFKYNTYEVNETETSRTCKWYSDGECYFKEKSDDNNEKAKIIAPIIELVVK